MSSRAKFSVLLVSSVVVVYSVVGGMMGRVNAQDGSYPQLTIFMEVIDRIRNDYVDEPSLTAAMEGAIRGMVEQIDPNGGYLSPESVEFYEDFDLLDSAGIGVVLVRKFDYPTILSAIPGGAAAEAGLGAGDTIEGIGGESLREHNLVEVHQLLSGDPNTPVELNVIRRSAAETESLTLIRAFVDAPPVEARIINEDDQDIGYVRIPLLSEGKAEETRQEIERLRSEGATSLVLDLRNSAGGSQTEAIELANLFLDSGILGYVEGQTVDRETFTASPTDAANVGLPLAVLINEGTADAAEIAAGALRDNDRGPVVGVRTFGFASVQRLLPLDDGWALLLSVANYYTPDGDEIQTEGIRPTVEVGRTAALEFDPLAIGEVPGEDAGEVPGEIIRRGREDPDEDPNADRQLSRAIELLLENVTGRAAA